MKIEASIGFPFFMLITVLFIAFKLSGIIAWSWWWVLSPLWLPPVILLFILLIFYAILSTVKMFIH